MRREQTAMQVLAKVVIGLVATGIALVCMAFAGDPERHSVIAYLQYLPYLVYLLPSVVAAFCSLSLGWRWRLLAVAALVLVLTEIMGLSIGRPDEGSGHIRFMTYNAKASYALGDPQGLGKLAQEIMANDPDVLVMQDAGEFLSVKAERPEAFAALVGKREVYAYGQYIVASRLPIKECAPGFIPFRDRSHTFVHCVLTAHGKDIDLVTVHFLTPRNGLNAVRHEGSRGLDEWRTNMTDAIERARTASGADEAPPHRGRRFECPGALQRGQELVEHRLAGCLFVSGVRLWIYARSFAQAVGLIPAD
jgi:vancomycin resistance protein VanJ